MALIRANSKLAVEGDGVRNWGREVIDREENRKLRKVKWGIHHGGTEITEKNKIGENFVCGLRQAVCQVCDTGPVQKRGTFGSHRIFAS